MNSKQQYKGVTLSRTVVKNNIEKIYNRSSKEDRRDWYQEAHEFAQSLSRDYDVRISTACGIIAALSPLKAWEQNKKCAISFLEVGNGKHMKTFQEKAEQLLGCSGSDKCITGILRGNKIISFYTNIMYPQEAKEVTIDRHALSIALGRWTTEDDYRGMTRKQYTFFQDCYRYAAERIGISPAKLQSATWEAFRKIKKEY